MFLASNEDIKNFVTFNKINRSLNSNRFMESFKLKNPESKTLVKKSISVICIYQDYVLTKEKDVSMINKSR